MLGFIIKKEVLVHIDFNMFYNDFGAPFCKYVIFILIITFYVFLDGSCGC